VVDEVLLFRSRGRSVRGKDDCWRVVVSITKISLDICRAMIKAAQAKYSSTRKIGAKPAQTAKNTTTAVCWSLFAVHLTDTKEAGLRPVAREAITAAITVITMMTTMILTS
jgi:hypothetical protein